MADMLLAAHGEVARRLLLYMNAITLNFTGFRTEPLEFKLQSGQHIRLTFTAFHSRAVFLPRYS